jgi:hypothetical protein
MVKAVPLMPNAPPVFVMDSRPTLNLAYVETFSVMAPLVDEIWNAIQAFASRGPAPEVREPTDRPAPAPKIVFLAIAPVGLVERKLWAGMARPAFLI